MLKLPISCVHSYTYSTIISGMYKTRRIEQEMPNQTQISKNHYSYSAYNYVPRRENITVRETKWQQLQEEVLSVPANAVLVAVEFAIHLAKDVNATVMASAQGMLQKEDVVGRKAIRKPSDYDKRNCWLLLPYVDRSERKQ